MMDALALVKAINAAAEMATALTGLAGQVKAVLGSADETAINEALKTLQASNDALHRRVQDKLRNA